MRKKVSIIGGGSAALMLAASLDDKLFKVCIFERNYALGRKFLVAGDGGFNLTHSEELDLFIKRYTPASFFENALQRFSNNNLRKWLNNLGIETYVGTSKRVFPVKGIKPIDVLNAFINELKKKNVTIKTQYKWCGWTHNNKLLFKYKDEEIIEESDITIFALGGASWKKTGSDGGWTNYFSEKGIQLVPFQASNCAYKIKWDKTFIENNSGKSLKNICISCGDTHKKGEVVLTIFGLEGGAIYALSPEIRKQLNEKGVAFIFIDLKPLQTVEEIKSKLSVNTNRSVSEKLKNELHLAPQQIALLKTVLSKEEYINLAMLAAKIKQLPLTITSAGPLDEAISTVGGISLEEVDETFQLKRLTNNYVIGEMLDWDAPTGGYLLQACFSMGHYLAETLNNKYR